MRGSSSVVAVAGLVFVLLWAGQVPAGTDASGRRAAPEVRPGDADWRMVADDFFPAEQRSAKQGRPLEIHLVRRRDAWAGGFALAPTWNHACHEVDATGLAYEAGAVKGTVRIRLNSDGWVPRPPATSEASLAIAARLEQGSIAGTYKGSHAGRKVAGRLAGGLSGPRRSLNGCRIRVRMVDPSQYAAVLWWVVRAGAAADAYVFESQWVGPADVSGLGGDSTSVKGTVRAASGGKDGPAAAYALDGHIVGGCIAGAVQREGVSAAGTFAGTVLPLAMSRIAPYRKPAAATQETQPATGTGAGQAGRWPDRWKGAFHLPAGVPDPPAGLLNVYVLPPQDEGQRSGRRCPVLLHNGVGGAQGAILRAIQARKMPPTVYAQVSLGGDGNDGSLDTICRYIDRYWPTIPRPEARGAMGFSAGAHHLFRYIDRSDLVGAFAFFGHPLQAAGWATQKAAEQEALLRGRAAWKLRPPAVLLVAGSAEGGYKGLEPTRAVLERFGVKPRVIAIPGLRHSHAGHFERAGDEIWAWFRGALPATAETRPDREP